MLTAKLFKNTEIKCADNYIMLSTYVCDSDEIIDIIAKHGVIELIFSPAKSMVRITIKTPLENSDTNVITVENPTHKLLRTLWGLDVAHLNKAIQTYLMQGEIKVNDGIKVWKDGKWIDADLPEDERHWIIASIASGKSVN